MKVSKNTVVSVAYLLKNDEGHMIDQATVDAPLDYLHGHQNMVVGFEKALEGKAQGDKFSVTLAPEEAYGEYIDEMVQRVPAAVFQGVEQVEVGMRFMADTDQGPIAVEVTEVDGDDVVVDANHMLAGQTLHFDIEVVAIREATEEEIEHGHLHQGGGCCGGHGGCGDHDHGDDHECCGGGGCCSDDEPKEEKDGCGCGCSH